MTLLRNLADDLVEKRLWPIAAALLAAIVAVPLVLGGGGPAAGDALPAPAAGDPPAGQTAQVRLDTAQPASARRRSSKARNPFASRSMPKEPAAAAAAPPAAAATPPAPDAPGSALAPSASKPIPAAPKATVAPDRQAPAATNPPAADTRPPAAANDAAPKREIAYRVAWRFGEAGAEVGNHNAARLTALPSPAQPAIHYLGLRKRKSGAVAVFLVKPSVRVHGDGRCEPDPSACQILEMRPGDVGFVELPAGTGGLVQYRFHVVHIDRKKVTQARARRLRLRESKAGRQALRAAIDAGVPGVAKFVFDRAKGLLAPSVPSASQ